MVATGGASNAVASTRMTSLASRAASKTTLMIHPSAPLSLKKRQDWLVRLMWSGSWRIRRNAKPARPSNDPRMSLIPDCARTQAQNRTHVACDVHRRGSVRSSALIQASALLSGVWIRNDSRLRGGNTLSAKPGVRRQHRSRSCEAQSSSSVNVPKSHPASLGDIVDRGVNRAP